MTVTVVDRGKGRDYQFRLVTVTVADTCPACGGPRGVPELRSYCEDGEWYRVHNWSNPCGHLDRYPDVIAEAARVPA